jgi:hypothetical protein
VIYDDNEGPPVVSYVGLVPMLKTMLRCFETGVYYVNDSGQLDVGIPIYFEEWRLKGRLKKVDISEFKSIAREFNPNIKRWV